MGKNHLAIQIFFENGPLVNNDICPGDQLVLDDDQGPVPRKLDKYR